MTQLLAGSKITLLAAAAAAAVSFAACSPVKGYSGPELPPEQIAAVFLQYDSAEADVDRATANGYEFSGSGIHLLPGKIALDAAVSVKERPRDCDRCYKVNDYSYQSCLDENEKKRRDGKSYRDCRWEDYAEVREICEVDVHDGSCAATFQGRAGRQYDVRLYRSGRSPEMTVAERGTASPAAYGNCSAFRSRVEEEDNYVGTGSSYGVYSMRHCGY